MSKLQEELLELLEAKEAAVRYHKIDTLFPDKGPYRRELYPKHVGFMNASASHAQLAFVAANRCLAEGTMVATPYGPKAIETLVVGDYVYDRYGEETKVTAVWDNGVKETISMQNRGKEYFRCTPEHKLDCVEIDKHTAKWDEGTNKELILKAKDQHRYSLVRRVKVKSELGSVHYKEAYALGALLGDGCCTCGSSTRLVISSKDDKVVKKVASELNTTYGKYSGNNYSYYIDSEGFTLYNEFCRDRLTHEKLVDIEVIKTWDRDSLLRFLAGLMDTDGSLSSCKDGYILRFTNQSKSIIDAAAYCFLALWNEPVTISIDKRDKYKNGPVYSTTIRNPHAVKYICSELHRELVNKYKAEPNYSVPSGSKSRPEALKLTPVYDGKQEHTYDITVASEEHLFLLANGLSVSNTGKTLTGACLMAYHLTGIYPQWYTGRKFLNPVSAWAVGVSNQSTKEIQQQELLGDVNDQGTGTLPKDLIVKVTKKPGVADAIETVYVKHVSGGLSKCTFKSYEQGRDSFQGTKKQFIWLDEEPRDKNIYSECLTRTMDDTAPGIIICTFTPLFGLSDVVLSFLPDGQFPPNGIIPGQPDKYITQVSWEEVPHLSESQKSKILESYTIHERAARSKGVPSLGAGAIYPYLEEDITVQPFEIPAWWPRAYGLDVGWNKTAAVWGAMDPESRAIYIYSEHYEGYAQPALHASAIKARGDWIEGAIDPASGGHSQADGRAMRDLYEQEGLRLVMADNAVEAGIYKVGQGFASGQLKIFTTCRNLLAEYRTYRRDENGKIVKKNDHALDALRYFMMTGVDLLTCLPDPDAQSYSDNNTSGKDKLTGY